MFSLNLHRKNPKFAQKLELEFELEFELLFVLEKGFIVCHEFCQNVHLKKLKVSYHECIFFVIDKIVSFELKLKRANSFSSNDLFKQFLKFAKLYAGQTFKTQSLSVYYHFLCAYFVHVVPCCSVDQCVIFNY